jgi:hypothetical protein
MTVKFTKWQRLFEAVFLAAFVFHVGSLCFLVRHFGTSSVFEIGNGFIAMYWGGEKADRDLTIYNCGQWPVLPDTHYAGVDELPAGMKWEWQGQDFGYFSDCIRYWGFFRTFGYTLPEWRHDDGAECFLFPIGTAALIVEIGALIFLFKSRASAM